MIEIEFRGITIPLGTVVKGDIFAQLKRHALTFICCCFDGPTRCQGGDNLAVLSIRDQTFVNPGLLGKELVGEVLMRMHGSDGFKQGSTGPGSNRDIGRTLQDTHRVEWIRKGLGTGFETRQATVDYVRDTRSPQWQKDGLLMNVLQNFGPLRLQLGGVRFALNLLDLGQKGFARQGWVHLGGRRVFDVCWDGPGIYVCGS